MTIRYCYPYCVCLDPENHAVAFQNREYHFMCDYPNNGEVEGHIVVVETQTIESMHDFAQALVDIGTTNDIYLVGSSAMGWSMDAAGNGTKMGLWDPRKIKNISFIVWAK